MPMFEQKTCQACGRQFIWDGGHQSNAAALICKYDWEDMRKYYASHSFQIQMFREGHVEAWLTHYRYMQEKKDVREKSGS